MNNVDSVLLRYKDFKRKAITFSYDDDCVTNIDLKKIFDAHGAKCTFNLNGGLFPDERSGRHMPASEMIELLNDGKHEIALHGYRHLTLTQVDNSAAAIDVLMDKLTLEKMFGRIVKGMAYGNGKTDSRVVALLKQIGIKYARTTNSTKSFSLPEDFLRWNPTCHHFDPQMNKYFDDFLANTQRGLHDSDPIVFYIWGHGYECLDRNDFNTLDCFLKRADEHKDEICYMSNGEIFDYVENFKRLEMSADRKIIYNPTMTDFYLEINFERYKLGRGETLRL